MLLPRRRRPINLLRQPLRVPSNNDKPAPELLLPSSERGVLYRRLEALELDAQVVLVAAERVPPVPQDLDACREPDAALLQHGVAAARRGGPHARLQVVAREDGVEPAVDLVQARVEVRHGALLRLEAVREAREAGAENGDEARRGLLLEGLLPLARVLVGEWLVEGDVCLVHLVVEVVLEDAVGVRGVVLVEELLDLVGDGLLVCDGMGSASDRRGRRAGG